MWQRLAKSVRNNILVGLMLVTPLAVTFWILNFLFTYSTNYLVPRHWLQTHFGVLYRFAALLLVFCGLYLIGLLTRNFIGRSLYRFADRLLTRIPFINTVYSAVRQLSESVFSSTRGAFQRVVAVQFPRKGVYSLGFVTGEMNSRLRHRLIEGQPEWQDAVCVLVPTAPNPTTGFFIIVPRDELIFLDISVTDATKMIVSAGAIAPGQHEEAGKTLLDRLEEWLGRDTGATPKQ